VVLDPSKRLGEYWSQSYSVKLVEKGNFALAIDHLWDAPKNKIALYLCLKGGGNTATGERESF
jgi:hypothetical protein